MDVKNIFCNLNVQNRIFLHITVFFLQKSMKIFNIFRVFDMKIFKRRGFYANRTISLYVYKKRDSQDIEKV